MSVVTPAQLRDHLNINASDTNVTDALLQGFIDASEDLIADRIGPLTSQAVTADVVNSNGSLVVPHAKCPVIAVTSATNKYYGNSIPANLFVIEPGNVLFVPFAYLAPGVWTVTYTQGWATTPNRVIFAIKELARHLWKTQRMGGPGSDMPGDSHAWPWRVTELIANLMDDGMG